jgi:hypothetical protein
MSVYVTGASNLWIGPELVERSHRDLYVTLPSRERKLGLETLGPLGVLSAALRE